MQKKEKEIVELDVKVQNLEKDKEEKVGCISAYLAIGYKAVYEKWYLYIGARVQWTKGAIKRVCKRMWKFKRKANWTGV